MASSRTRSPLAWFRRAEDRVWALFAEVEYRLGVVPRGTPLAPRPFDRRLLRTCLSVVPLLLGSLFIPPPLRTRLLLLLFLLVLLVVAAIFVADAREGVRGGGPPAPSRRSRPGPAAKTATPPRPAPRGVASSSAAPRAPQSGTMPSRRGPLPPPPRSPR